MTYIVVGNSAAGLFAAEEIRKHDSQSELIVLTAEQEPSYSRCLTTYFLTGDIPVSQLYLRTPDFAERLNLTILYGVKVSGIDPQQQIVRSADGQEWHYDKLLLAMGSSAKKLAIPGAKLPEVFTLRTMDDALAINKLLEQGVQRAVIIGGGLVSLKSAYALRKRGLDVTVAVSSGQILSQMLDTKAAGLIQEHLRINGLKVLLGTEALSILGKDHVQGVLVSPETELAADLVIVGKGVRPNIQDLGDLGFNIGYGLQVNSSLETNLPNIYAAGDLAETWDLVRQTFTLNATWPNAATQGRIAGANMCGKEEVYPGSLGLNSVDFFGLSAVSVGITKLSDSQKPDNWTEEENLKIVGDKPNYRKLIWQEDLLKGFILVGDISQCGVLTSLIKAGRPLTQPQRNLTLGKLGTLAVGIIK
ncbi:NAD(P)/FAD-dependent oxidoreductase [Desulfosporosinus meridiei]|uniref:NAD(P)H-nitrite reductase n=1 Tax=Desulfosporosinus meridiei (strain ATCC BAA-275 / DSM 13257 / KCTC 12902 / NCIMB 13706 / S10) TaxID=768704 RepID=J7IYH2_DESMD|nr:FAD-dependent oxidoreductase [Desulfosporosinus meridiei]AFQ43756.1 NAD(P)H-nitrite reductase [Desulfosporosinus meridiei DSM 13257]